MKTARIQFTIGDGLVVMVLMMVGLAVISPWLVEHFGNPVSQWPRPSRPLGWLERYPWDARIKCFLCIITSSLLGGIASLVIINSRCLVTWRRAAGTAIGIATAWLLMCFLVSVYQSYFRWHRRGQIAPAAACKAYEEAQQIYRRTDCDGDGVLEYAQSLQQLLERTPGSGDLALVDRTFAGAECTLPKPTPKAGYIFKALLAQGVNARGGRRNYVVKESSGRVKIDGFALVAAPTIYDVTGRDTFLIGMEGIIYQADLGEDTFKFLQDVIEYDPDSTWTPAE